MLTASVQKGKTSCNKFPGYDTIPPDGGAPVQELWGMGTTPSLSSLPCSIWPRELVPIRVPFMAQTEVFNYLLFLKSFNYGQIND